MILKTSRAMYHLTQLIALSSASGDVFLRARIKSQLSNCDDMERAIDRAVATSVQPESSRFVG